MVETYSVLTRLPPPHRVAPQAVRAYLDSVSSADYLTLDSRAYRELIDRLSRHGIAGGATYDALVGSAATAAGATLLTRDHRAVRTYELLQVGYELVS